MISCVYVLYFFFIYGHLVIRESRSDARNTLREEAAPRLVFLRSPCLPADALFSVLFAQFQCCRSIDFPLQSIDFVA